MVWDPGRGLHRAHLGGDGSWCLATVCRGLSSPCPWLSRAPPLSLFPPQRDTGGPRLQEQATVHSPPAGVRTQRQLRGRGRPSDQEAPPFPSKAWMENHMSICPPSQTTSWPGNGPSSEISGGTFCERTSPLRPRTNKGIADDLHVCATQ